MNNKQPVNEKQELRRNQVLGIIVGLIGGWLTGNFWPALPATLTWGGVLLWGAALGGVLGSLTQFEKVGKRLTRSANQALNLAVGLSLPLLVIGLLLLVARLLRLGV